MADVFHGQLGPGIASGVHVIHDWVVGSQAAREALPVTEAMVGKVCRQTDTSPASFWLLVRVTGGVSWMQIGAQGMTSGQAADLANALAKANALGTQEYVVKTLTTDLTAERALEGTANQIDVDWATPNKVILKASTNLRLPVNSFPAATPVATALATDGHPEYQDAFDVTGVTVTAADIGRVVLAGTGSSARLYVLTEYQATVPTGAP